VRRYGFHGLSLEYIASVVAGTDARAAASRTVVAHLGSGASLCAMREGKSVATTMGFSALDGLMMGTRCGAIDPGVLLHLMDRYDMDARSLESLLYQQSGLLGVSEISADMRELLDSRNHRASFAVDLFVYRIARELGSLAAALGGLDALVFTGGIGENAPATRQGLPRRRLARPSSGRRGQREKRSLYQWAGQPGVRVGHPHRRGTDDRLAYPACAGIKRRITLNRMHSMRLWRLSRRPSFPGKGSSWVMPHIAVETGEGRAETGAGISLRRVHRIHEPISQT
jgi:hypothetical protein